MSIHSFPEHPVLLVDDEPRALKSLTITLEFEGINNVHPCQDESGVMGILEEEDIEAVLLDMIMPKISGRAFLRRSP